MKYALFLDDERFPPVQTKVQRNWKIARTYKKAIEIVEKYGIPEHISFDHDLGWEEKTGKDFANWLVEWCMDHDWPYFTYSVHSMNPEGARNIDMLIFQYLAESLQRPSPNYDEATGTVILK